jgi:ABC-2 type transport system permease protein
MLIQPLIFVVLFGYVFGSAITVPGINYREFLMPGVFAMTMAGTLVAAATGTAEDKSKGIINRLRTMPIARSVALIGSTLSNLAEACLSMVILIISGLAVGWRTHQDVPHLLAGFGLLLLLQFAMNWVGTLIGLLVSSAESADTIAMLIFLPISFLANTFVPTGGMPAWLRIAAEWSPVSATVAACRELFGNTGTATPLDSWPMQHPVMASAGWSILLLAIFMPLCVRRYRTMSER